MNNYHEFNINTSVILSEEQMQIVQAAYERAIKQGYKGNMTKFIEGLLTLGCANEIVKKAKLI